MDFAKFRAAHDEFEKFTPRLPPEKSRALREKMRSAAEPEHVGSGKSEGFSDCVLCSCGWKSPGYWDMLEAAWDDWYAHVADALGLVPKKCPCGKIYIPADTGGPCHELRPLKKP
jgi:hypothetical protein